MMLEAIAKELKITRIRKSLELNDVAKDLNLNKITLSRYENNASGLSVERLEELLNYYNVSKAIFFKNVCENMHENNCWNDKKKDMIISNYLKEYFKEKNISIRSQSTQ